MSFSVARISFISVMSRTPAEHWLRANTERHECCPNSRTSGLLLLRRQYPQSGQVKPSTILGVPTVTLLCQVREVPCTWFSSFWRIFPATSNLELLLFPLLAARGQYSRKENGCGLSIRMLLSPIFRQGTFHCRFQDSRTIMCQLLLTRPRAATPASRSESSSSRVSATRSCSGPGGSNTSKVLI